MNLFEANRYQAPNDPFMKFRSDLARELTAKQVPVWNYSKTDKKSYRTPATLLDWDDVPYIETSDSSTMSIQIGRYGDVIGWVKSEGKGEEYFQNTNPFHPDWDEGYKTDENFYYQGPTWKITGEGNNFKKEGLTRNQLADAIIECIKVGAPSFDITGKWNEIVKALKDRIDSNESYKEENMKRIENPTGQYSAYADPELQYYIHKQIKKYDIENERILEALEPPALPPDLNSFSEPDRKNRSYFVGTIDSKYSSSVPYVTWVMPAWNRADALKQVKEKFCRRRNLDGTRRELDYDPKSIKVIGKFENKEEAEKWEADMHKGIRGSFAESYRPLREGFGSTRNTDIEYSDDGLSATVYNFPGWLAGYAAYGEPDNLNDEEIANYDEWSKEFRLGNLIDISEDRDFRRNIFGQMDDCHKAVFTVVR